jgi:hypothetical protein
LPVNVKHEETRQKEAEDRLNVGTKAIDFEFDSGHVNTLAQPINSHISPCELCNNKRGCSDSLTICFGPYSCPANKYVSEIMKIGDDCPDECVRHIAEGVEICGHQVMKHHLYVIVVPLFGEKLIQKTSDMVAHCTSEVKAIRIRMLNVGKITELVIKAA